MIIRAPGKYPLVLRDRSMVLVAEVRREGPEFSLSPAIIRVSSHVALRGGGRWTRGSDAGQGVTQTCIKPEPEIGRIYPQ